MDNKRFESLMRQGEKFHGARLPSDEWIVLRVDGHGFTKLTAQGFQKPFDARFRDAMVQAASALLDQFGGVYAYTESDEISLLLPQNWNLFSRSHEKTISLSAGLASAVFSQTLGTVAHFDSRVWLGKNLSDVTDYFRWRQADATRCALNGWCYWTLRQNGRSYAQATAELHGQTPNSKRELLLRHSIDFEQLPDWQKHGLGLFWESYETRGFDPRSGQETLASRRRIAVIEELPEGNGYNEFILSLVNA